MLLRSIFGLTCWMPMLHAYKHTLISFQPFSISSFRRNHRRFDVKNDGVFGMEFQFPPSTSITPSSVVPSAATSIYPEIISDSVIVSSEESSQLLTGRKAPLASYQKLRQTVLGDSIMLAVLGCSGLWLWSTYTFATSYAIGAVLGIAYSVLLGKYVERLGTTRENRAIDNARFLPVIVMVAIYAKNRETVSVIMELIGFVATYQVASLLQIFNNDAYGEEEVEEILKMKQILFNDR